MIKNYLISRMPFIKTSGARLALNDRVPPSEVKQLGIGMCWLYDAIQTLLRVGLVKVPGDSPSGVYRVTVWDYNAATPTWRNMYVKRQPRGIIDDRCPQVWTT